MAPGTGSRKPPASRKVVHQSSPVLHQLRFPARRKTSRTHGPQAQHDSAAYMKQQTLTQIDFVSSFMGDVGDREVAMSESEAEEDGPDDYAHLAKPPQRSGKEKRESNASLGRYNSQAIKRPYQETNSAGNAKGRPASTGVKRQARTSTYDNGNDMCTSDQQSEMGSNQYHHEVGSNVQNYHTQTLTQFLHPTPCIADSDDDDDSQDLGDVDDEEFLSWLGKPQWNCTEQKPNESSQRAKTDLAHHHGSGSERGEATPPRPNSRAESIVAQTPAKVAVTPSRKYYANSQSISESGSIERFSASHKLVTPSLEKSNHHNGFEKSDISDNCLGSDLVPWSMEIEDLCSTESSTPLKDNSRHLRRRDAASATEQVPSQPGQTRANTASCISEIPDSDADEDDELQDNASPKSEPLSNEQETYVLGSKTQLAMLELLDAVYPSQSAKLLTTELQSPLSPSDDLKTRRNISFPIISQRNQCDTACPISTTTVTSIPSQRPMSGPGGEVTWSQSQQIESQRVPARTLQCLPPATPRSDIMVSIPSSMLVDLLNGHRSEIDLTFKIPSQVVRFWLLDNAVLRYVACVETSEQKGHSWLYHVSQVYELNNPMNNNNMRQEGWIGPHVNQYVYFPPAVVGQLLWNLRHAIFSNENVGNEGEVCTQLPDESPRASQQVAAQLQDDFAQSARLLTCEGNAIAPPGISVSSRSLQLKTPSEAYISRNVGSTTATIGNGYSQLLTKSQILPDSLVCDGLKIPPEIWDSQDEEDSVC